jgi:hypothetical protein
MLRVALRFLSISILSRMRQWNARSMRSAPTNPAKRSRSEYLR